MRCFTTTVDEYNKLIEMDIDYCYAVMYSLYTSDVHTFADKDNTYMLFKCTWGNDTFIDFDTVYIKGKLI